MCGKKHTYNIIRINMHISLPQIDIDIEQIINPKSNIYIFASNFYLFMPGMHVRMHPTVLITPAAVGALLDVGGVAAQDPGPRAN